MQQRRISKSKYLPYPCKPTHGQFPMQVKEYAAEARRKAAGARSRMTGKPIADSAGEKRTGSADALDKCFHVHWTSSVLDAHNKSDNDCHFFRTSSCG